MIHAWVKDHLGHLGLGSSEIISSWTIWYHLGSYGIIWVYLGSSGPGIIWDHVVWDHLGSSGIIWDHLGSSGIIRVRGRLGSFGSGIIWDHFVWDCINSLALGLGKREGRGREEDLPHARPRKGRRIHSFDFWRSINWEIERFRTEAFSVD